MYAFTENFVLPLSHDEVVHGKGSLLDKMPGDRWQQLANLRALYAYMWAHPGKKLLFMGGEFAQEQEWSHDRSLDWHLLERPDHQGVQTLVGDLNGVYRDEPALWELDAVPDGLRVARAQRRGRQRDRVRALLRRRRARARVRLQLLAGRRGRAIASGCRSRAAGARCSTPTPAAYGGSGVGSLGAVEADETTLARAALVGRAAAAAARRGLAGARGSVDSGGLAIVGDSDHVR